MIKLDSSGRARGSRLLILASALSLIGLPNCSEPLISKRKGSGGAAGRASGGARTSGGEAGAATRGGSVSEGGAGGDGNSGGASTGGDEGTGGDNATGGTGGDSETGGTSTGGVSSSGGTPGTGGKSTGGVSSGGSSSGGSAGVGGADEPRPDFILGADISSVQESVDLGARYIDTDGVEKNMFELLSAHGFNAIRLRTFVDPTKLYGYDNPNGNASYVREQAYCDTDHTVTFGKQAKDAGMKLLVDLHYSDNWADPGKQVIPEDWRDATSIEDLGERVKAYTTDVIEQLVDGGARPDIVQVGNEIAPGLLIQVPAEPANADQWGNMNMQQNAINGAVPNWADLGLILRKGVEGVHAVDPDIKIMMHLANTATAGGVVDWVTNVKNNGVEFDILGLSCYTAWHGQPSVWQRAFETAAGAFPDLKFVIAEYNPEPRRANDIIRGLPDKRGLGTFMWEPTQSGSWGPSMFTYTGNKVYTAIPAAFAVYDQIREDYGME